VQNMVVLGVTICNLVGECGYFGGTCCFSLHGQRYFLKFPITITFKKWYFMVLRRAVSNSSFILARAKTFFSISVVWDITPCSLLKVDRLHGIMF
jgi:hypothetical protein